MLNAKQNAEKQWEYYSFWIWYCGRVGLIWIWYCGRVGLVVFNTFLIITLFCGFVWFWSCARVGQVGEVVFQHFV